MDTDVYKTKDLGEAAALYCYGLKLLNLEHGPNFYWFVFENNDARRVSDAYWSCELKLDVKLYNDSLKTLKDRLFANQGTLI